MSTGPEIKQSALTFAYKTRDRPIFLDLYPPSLERAGDNAPRTVPAVVFFHGGGLAVGDRTSWFPSWLKDRVTASGMAFISADYRLLPPSTGHDIVGDIQDLFSFLEKDINTLLIGPKEGAGLGRHVFLIDPTALAVAGASGGGLVAYLAAMHASPKPRALLALYAMGGNFLIPHYFSPKSGVFLRGREVLDPNDFTEFLHPQSASLEPISASSLAYHGPDYAIPGYPANPRMLLPRLYLQLGVWLDYYTSSHIPSLSAALREAAARNDDLDAYIPEEHRRLWPQLNVDSCWPPAFLVHGSADSAVPVEESRHMTELLKQAGVPVTLCELEEQEHSLDKAPNADALYGGPGGLFDEIRDFLVETLSS